MFWRLLLRLTAHQAIWGGAPPPVTSNALLLEDGVSYLLMEDNASKLNMEA